MDEGKLHAAVLTVLYDINAELKGLAISHGCEAGAQRAYLRGKYDGIVIDLWKALGLAPLAEQIDTDLLLDPVKTSTGLHDRQAPVD